MPQTASDLTVTLQEDRPGVLAAAMEAVARAGINLEGIAQFDGVPVLMVAVEDRPGASVAALRRLADAGHNVDYCYLATNTRLVIAGDEPKRLAQALE